MTTNPVTRRNFLKAAGITLGASTLLCSGVGFAATRSPKIDTPSFTYREANPSNKRILVTYATRAGSTVDIAAAMGETLGKRGYWVDVKPVK